MSTPPTPKNYNAATHNPPRLCGWSAQGEPRQDREAREIHEAWIRKSPRKGSK